MVTIPPRKDEDEAVEKPVMITDYNQSMRSVDLCDQLLNYYALSRKTRKWWKKLFFRLLELCIINSMILCKARNPGFAKRHMAHNISRNTGTPMESIRTQKHTSIVKNVTSIFAQIVVKSITLN